MKNTYLQLRNLIGQTVTAMVQTPLIQLLKININFMELHGRAGGGGGGGGGGSSANLSKSPEIWHPVLPK